MEIIRGMNILILEDDPARMHVFTRNLIGTNTVIVDNVPDAISELSSRNWDYLFLDHDLGGQQMVESGDDTGYAVAAWLEEHLDKKPPNIVIHSLNPAGAQNMKNALPEAVLAPGCWASLRISEG